MNAKSYPNRTYYVGANLEENRLMIVVNLPLRDLPFAVWRDILQMCSMSLSTPDKEIFFFPRGDEVVGLQRAIEESERILNGAFFRRES